jgi:hypothetical protein
MERCQMLGEVPERWVPPVSEDAPPILSPPVDLRSIHVSQATAIKNAAATWRMGEVGGPVRLDLSGFVASADRVMTVATAILLPSGMRAQLASAQGDMLARRSPPAPGRSALSVVIDRVDGRPWSEAAASGGERTSGRRRSTKAKAGEGVN